jgi:hypothetical protein
VSEEYEIGGTSLIEYDARPARLPEAYETAKRALAACADIDECKDWADRAAALASYAKQARDTTLRKNATRIQARAVRRIGELIKLIPPAAGGRPSAETLHGADNSFQARKSGITLSSRERARRSAGLSRRQAVTAVQVSKVPAEDFERQIESDAPPTVTALAERGKAKRDPVPEPERARAAFLANANQALRFAAYSGPIDTEIVAAAHAVATRWFALADRLSLANGK